MKHNEYVRRNKDLILKDFLFRVIKDICGKEGGSGSLKVYITKCVLTTNHLQTTEVNSRIDVHVCVLKMIHTLHALTFRSLRPFELLHFFLVTHFVVQRKI